MWRLPGQVNACGEPATECCIPASANLPPSPCARRIAAAAAARAARNAQLRGAPSLSKFQAYLQRAAARNDWDKPENHREFKRICRAITTFMENIDETNMPGARSYVNGWQKEHPQFGICVGIRG